LPFLSRLRGDFGECAIEFFGIPHLRLIQFPRRKDEKS
jgi:hypothetical protein